MSLPRVKVADLSEQVRGVSYGKEDASSTPKEGYVPILRAGNITDSGLTFDDLVFVPVERVSEKQIIRCYDVVIAASSGSLDIVGKAAPALVDFTGSFGAFCKVLRPNSKVYPGYFAHFFKTRDYRRRISALATGANINNLRNEHLDELEIPLPNLEEQKRIAEILDRAEELRSKRREAIAQLDTLTQAIFLEMFGDPVSNLKGWKRLPFAELLINIDSGWSPVCLDRPVSGEEWGVLKLGAVTWCEYNSTENKALPLGVKPNPALEVKTGDLLFTRKNTYELVGACAIVRETPPRLLMSDLIFRFRLRADAAVNPYFLHQLLIYPTKRRNIQKLAGGSASSMPNISKAKLQTTLIELPPLNLQEEFARRVEAVEKLKAAHRASLSELDALFASLQHRAFRGEL
jgi:type I restriction enzyme S subunit